MITWRRVTEGKCRKLSDVPKSAEIVDVNGREVFGMCEVCGRPILDGQAHNYDSDGVYWHDRCPRTPNAEAHGRAVKYRVDN